MPWRDLNLGLLVPEADAMSTVPRRQGNIKILVIFNFKRTLKFFKNDCV
jgi:hypothetical protein